MFLVVALNPCEFTDFSGSTHVLYPRYCILNIMFKTNSESDLDAVEGFDFLLGSGRPFLPGSSVLYDRSVSFHLQSLGLLFRFLLQCSGQSGTWAVVSLQSSEFLLGSNPCMHHSGMNAEVCK